MKTNLSSLTTAASLTLALLACVSAAPLVPQIFGVAQEQGRTASARNMKQVGIALLEYEQDYDENTPNAANWSDALGDYLKLSSSRGSLRDPSAPAGVKYSYAFNRNLSRKHVSVIELPAKTVMLSETTKNASYASDTGHSVPHPGRHAGGSLYVFADGRVKWIADGTKPSYQLSGK